MSNCFVYSSKYTFSRESVESVAKTNPGDGSKRLYGDVTFIHDGSDIDGVHPDAVRGQQKKPSKKATVEDVEDEYSDSAIRRYSKKASINSIIEDNEDDDDNDEMSYLEDTEARG